MVVRHRSRSAGAVLPAWVGGASRATPFGYRARGVVRAVERFRAKYGRAPEREELRDVKLENRRANELTTRDDLDQAWRETAQRYRFGPSETAQLLTGEREQPQRTLLLPTEWSVV